MSALIIANWKMNGNKETLNSYCEGLNAFYSQMNPPTNTVIIPSFPFLWKAHELLYHPQCYTGAQDCSSQNSGPFTGDVSASMIRNCGAHYVIVGHSERRKYHNESTEIFIKKIIAALDAELIPIFCFGENEDEYKSGKSSRIILNELQEVLCHNVLAARSIPSIVLAYEPIWAIGTGLTPEASQVQNQLMQLENFLLESCPHIRNFQFVYGGSVSAENFESFMKQSLIQGALVGGASLKLETFIPLIEIAARKESL